MRSSKLGKAEFGFGCIWDFGLARFKLSAWENVDLESGRIRVRKIYIRKEHRIKDYTKGERWQSHRMPDELWEKLKAVKSRVKQ